MFALFPTNILFFYGSRIADNQKTMVGKSLSNNAPGPDNGIIPDEDPLPNKRSPAYPDMLPYMNISIPI